MEQAVEIHASRRAGMECHALSIMFADDFDQLALAKSGSKRRKEMRFCRKWMGFAPSAL
jgi:hypothetical protein